MKCSTVATEVAKRWFEANGGTGLEVGGMEMGGWMDDT